MTEERSKQHARDVLEEQGCTVTAIPAVQGEKRADLLAVWDEQRYLVEAKGRELSEAYEALVRTANEGAPRSSVAS